MPSGPELELLVWVVVAILSGIGELLTGSFFLLPFAIGAAAAGLAAAFGVRHTLRWKVRNAFSWCK